MEVTYGFDIDNLIDFFKFTCFKQNCTKEQENK
jgi:hypothetical protein